MMFETMTEMRKRKKKSVGSSTKLAKFLDERDIRQKEIAGILNITPQQVSNIYWGVTPLGREYMHRLTQYYSLPWDYFFDDSEKSTGRVQPESTNGGLALKEPPQEYGIRERDIEVDKIIKMAIEVLQSNTHYGKSLRMNILSFADALRCSRELEELRQSITDITQRIETLERTKGTSPPSAPDPASHPV